MHEIQPTLAALAGAQSAPLPLAGAKPEPSAGDTQVSDEALMERYRDGDEVAFRALYARHWGGLRRFIARQCGQRANADEVFQEVWHDLIRARGRYRPQARFRTYLYQIARNRLIDLHRANTRARLRLVSSNDGDADPPDTSPGADPARQAERQELADRIAGTLEGLPAPQREVFLLRAEGGLTLEEIAGMTGVNRETVKSRLRYALEKLRQAFGGTI